MLGTGLATIDTTGEVSIYPGPVGSGLGEVSHLLNSSMVAMQVTEHSLIQLRRYTHSVSLQQYSIFDGELILGSPEMACYSWNFLDPVGPVIQGQPVHGAVDGISFYSSSDYVQFVWSKVYVMDILV